MREIAVLIAEEFPGWSETRVNHAASFVHVLKLRGDIPSVGELVKNLYYNQTTNQFRLSYGAYDYVTEPYDDTDPGCVRLEGDRTFSRQPRKNGIDLENFFQRYGLNEEETRLAIRITLTFKAYVERVDIPEWAHLQKFMWALGPLSIGVYTDLPDDDEPDKPWPVRGSMGWFVEIEPINHNFQLRLHRHGSIGVTRPCSNAEVDWFSNNDTVRI
jgi:hypothetical protein